MWKPSERGLIQRWGPCLLFGLGAFGRPLCCIHPTWAGGPVPCASSVKRRVMLAFCVRPFLSVLQPGAECPRGCHPLCAPCSPLSAHTTFIGNLVSCLMIFLGREYFASKCGDHSFVCFAPCTKRGNVQKLLGFKGISKCWDCNGGRLTFHSC